MVSNFFKLREVHTVVKDFITSHNTSMQTYASAYSYLQNFPNDDEEAKTPQGKKAVKEFQHNLSSSLIDLQTAYTNLLVSYHAFRVTAQRDPQIMAEFKKLPPDMTPLQKQFHTILDGYMQSIGELKAGV
jgi:hypothetical protein